MADRPQPSYGTPNWEMISRWLELPPEDDGPFWALNLMKYHAVASYADGEKGVSGREADDAYAPLGPLAAVGARVAFLADVVDQPLGQPHWDRVGIVRYPSRAAFFAMQQRDDFKQQHVHKEAAMEFTIVMSCLPAALDPDAAGDGRLVLVVERGGVEPGAGVGATTVVDFGVEGVIVGDERRFDRARFIRVADPAALTSIVEVAAASEEAHVLALDPSIDNLIHTIVSASSTDAP
jgi:hypothetical protein